MDYFFGMMQYNLMSILAMHVDDFVFCGNDLF